MRLYFENAVDANVSYRWALGSASVRRIAAIADRFRQLLLDEYRRERNVQECRYLPWMAVRSRRDALSPLITRTCVLPNALRLVDNAHNLELLADALRDKEHAVAAIVPQDIGVEVLTDTSLLAGWAEKLQEAEATLNLVVPWMGALCRHILQFVVPIRHQLDGHPKKRGFSTPLCYGAIFLTFEDRIQSEPWSVIELAIDLAHELGHHVLHTYQTADRIISSDLTAPVYSGIKRTTRPAIMSLHASMALAYMLIAACCLQKRCLDRLMSARLSKIIEDYATQQYHALSEIRAHCTFTALGKHILHDLQETLERPSGA